MIRYQLQSSSEHVVVADEVLAHFEQFRQTNAREEAGGQLFAKLERTAAVRIVCATGPASLDRRSRFSFIPNRWREQAEIFRMHRRGMHYVGDWHTHPQSIPRPSQHDVDSIADCYRRSNKQIGGFLLVIVGLNPFPDGLYVGLTDGRELHSMRLVDPTEPEEAIIPS